jgi:hypothetical protein
MNELIHQLMQLILEQTAVYQEFSVDFFVFILLWTYATTTIEEAAGLFFFCACF